MIIIDGSEGEGGGQIVRSSLSLSAITGKPFTIENVRAGRKKPGLKRQHLTCVSAAAGICGGKVTGAELGSNRLEFHPGTIIPGEYEFKVGTAGSAPLVAQTVLPALITCQSHSKITLEGGTHNPMAPTYEFFTEVYLPLVARMGPAFGCQLISHGFYPAGGGRFEITIEPAEQLSGLILLERNKAYKAEVTAIVSALPADVGQRECDTIRRKLGWAPNVCSVREVDEPRGPGNAVYVKIDSGNVAEMFVGIGAPGVRAEQVARAVAKKAKSYLALENIPVGFHLADQLLLPMGLAAARGQSSSFKTMPLTQHSQTHIEILQRFLEIQISVDEGRPETVVTVEPC